MALAHPSAVSWAQAHSAASHPRLGMLEAVAFQAHPKIVATFGVDGAAIARVLGTRELSKAARVRNALTTPFVIFAAAAPVVGLGVLGSAPMLDSLPSYDAALDARWAVPFASASFWVTAAFLLTLLGLWFAKAGLVLRVLRGFGVLSLICALFGAVAMPAVAQRYGFALSDIALLPVWLTVALGALATVLTFVRGGQRGDPAPNKVPASAAPSPATSKAATSKLAASKVAALNSDELEAILADRDAGLRVLVDRGLIPETLMETALIMPPGTLFTLDASSSDGS